jgi:hypothetical protein
MSFRILLPSRAVGADVDEVTDVEVAREMERP